MDRPLLPIPLNAAEQAEIERRDRVTTGYSRLIAQAERGDFPELGSLSLDHTTGRAIVGLTRDSAFARQRVTDELPLRSAVDFEVVPYSWSDLQKAWSSVGADFLALDAEGIVVLSVDHDWGGDRVLVTVSLPDSRSDAVATLQSRYGSGGVEFVGSRNRLGDERIDLSRTATSGSALGGQRLAINNGGQTPAVSCTLTGGARRPADGHLWLVTAGHCAPPGRSFYMSTPFGGDFLGTNPVSATWQYTTTYCDCLVINNNDPLRVSNFLLDDQTHLQGETSNFVNGQYAPGVHICFSSAGPTNGVRCGSMVNGINDQRTISFPGYNNQTIGFYDFVHTDVPSCHGDSGSPVYTGYTWAGILSHHLGADDSNGCGSDMVFTKTSYLPNYYSLSMLTYDP